jgi:thioredoxin reductase (NADPH)
VTDEPPVSAEVPLLTAEQRERIAAYGTPFDVDAGEMLFVEGDSSGDLFVVMSGAVEILRRSWDTEDLSVKIGAGSIIGELGVLTGQRRLLAARVVESGRMLRIPHEDLRRLLAADTELGKLVIDTFIARRLALTQNAAVETLQIFGSRFSPETLRLREWVARTRLPHRFVDLDGRAGGPPRPRLPRDPGAHLRHRHHRRGARGPRRGGVRRLRRPRHRRARRGRDRRPGERELAHRELPRVPGRHLR